MNMIYIALALVPLLVFVLMFVLVARTVHAARDAQGPVDLRRRYDEQD